MMINEQQMLQMLNCSQALLIEPQYQRKYPPLGLAKIAAYIQHHGGKCTFSRKPIAGDWDIVCITSLFSYDSHKVTDAINRMRFIIPDVPIVLGGVAASLIPKHFDRDDIFVFKGCSTVLDRTPPDLKREWYVKAPWDSFSYVFTSRGCPNRCPYCAVWKIEPQQTIVENWRCHIHDDKPYVMVSDNNLSSCSLEHLESVAVYLRDHNKSVVFDNGFDCKYITSDLASILSTLKYTRHGMRLAFDRIEEDGQFQDAVSLLCASGIPVSQIMAYVLFNFMDTPQQANYRMSECVKLKIRPYPQQYVPLGRTSRKPVHVGKHWTPMLLRAFRYFWLMAGYYTKTTFEEWARHQTKYELAKEDWEAWNGDTQNVSDAAVTGLEIWKHHERLRQFAATVGGRQWSTEPDVGRVANGIPSRVDRLRCLGNAVVPQVAEFIGYLIADMAGLKEGDHG